ncbi:MAG: hypothetical protein JWO13_2291 [Acidobacteriales bacterium]|nr:hypothetical protein [Terriglobales bacterium]
MPPVIAAIAALVHVIGVGLAAGGWTAFLTATALSVGSSLVLGGITKLIKGSTNLSLQSDTANHSVTIKQAAGYRRFRYGKGDDGGTLTYAASSGANSEYFHMVVTYWAHQIKAIDAIIFDDYQLVLDGAGNEIGKYAGGFCFVEMKLGAPGEPAFPGLVADTAGLGAAAWTASCRQDGFASIHVKLKLDPSKFPNGVPQAVKVVARCKLVKDPRTGVTDYTDNLACCIRDYAIDPIFGMGFDEATEINDTTFIAAANLADENVPQLAGGTKHRYTCNGGSDTSKKPGDVLKGMLANEANGKSAWIAGQLNLWLGSYRAPELSFNDDDLRGAPQLTGRTSRSELYNAVRGIFVSPESGYQPTDFPSVVNPAYVADDSGFPGCANRSYWLTPIAYAVNDAVFNKGFAYVCTNAHVSGALTEPGAGANWAMVWVLCPELHWKDVEYAFVNNASECQRLAKMDLEYGRRMFTVMNPMKLKGYQVQPPETLQLTQQAMNWVNKTFEMRLSSLLMDGMYLGVNHTLKEVDSGIWSWSILDERLMGAFPSVVTADPSVVAAVTGLTLVSGSATVVTRGDGVKLSRIRVTWNQPIDQFVLAGGKIFVEFKKHADPNWIPGDEVDGAAQESYLSGVDDNVAYDVRVRCRNSAGVYGAYVSALNHTVSPVTSHITQGALTSSTIGNKNSTIVGGVNPLSAADVGASVTVSIAAFQLQFGFGRVSYNASSIAGLSYNTGYFIYCVDALLAGGAVTYLATTSFDVVVANVNNVYIGSVGTPASGGSGTGGGGEPGGCCCIDQWFSEHGVIEVAEVGDLFDCYVGDGEVEPRMLEQMGPPKFVPCVALVAENGAEWRGSSDTTVHPKDSEPCFAEHAHRSQMKTYLLQQDGSWKLEWSPIRVIPLGMRWVRQGYIGKSEFAAGVDWKKRMFTHNSVPPPDPK